MSTFSLSQNLTGTAPSASTEGQAIRDFSAVTVVVEAASGQTLSGAGTLRAYVYDPKLNGGSGLWARCPDLDLTIPAGAASNRACAFQAMEVPGPRNARVLWITNSVTVSGGTTVTVYQLGFAPPAAGTY